MSGNSPVDPYEVPEFTGSWCELDQRVKALSGASTKIVTAATDVHTTFGGLRAFYRAPEAEQLFAVTEPVRTTAQLIGSDLSVIAGALRTYAQDGQPLVQRLNELRAEAQAFRTGPAADDEWREDADLIDENLDRRNKIAEVWAAFQDVEKACHGRIVSLVGGTPLKTDDGSGKEGMYGYDAEALKQAESLPWGDAVEESTPGWQVWEHAADFVTGFAVDGVWATVVGIGTLAGFNGWDAAGDAWSGLATLGEGLGATIIFGVNSPFWTLPEDQLPARMRESRVAVKETGKALLAWDDWEAHPGRAAGAVTFNVLTTVFTGGAGGAAATTAKAGAVAKALSVAGKVSRVVDPMTYVFKGAGAGLSKLGDAMASLRNLGKIQVPALPEGAIALPEGGYKLADGTLRLPEGSAIPEGAFAVPPRTVKLPEGTPLPAGAVDLGDGMVQLPRRGEVPAGAVAVQEGTVKVPAGATALPPNTVPLPGAGKGFFYNIKGDLFGADGTLLQRGTDAKPETPPDKATPDRAPAPATNPSVLPPARQPVLVGAGAADGARLGGDAGRLGAGLGDDGLRLGDDAPGPVPDRTPGGGAGDNMPTNNLDNGAGGRSGDTTPTGGGADVPSGGGTRDVPGGSTADNGAPGGSAADHGAGSGSGLPDAPGAGGVDDAARAGDDTAPTTAPRQPVRPEFMMDGPNPYGPRGRLTLEQIEDIQVYRANHEPGYFEQFYRKDGTRRSLESYDESGYTPPQLTRLSENAPLVRAKDVPPPPSPRYLDAEYISVGADTVTSTSRRRALEEAAQARHFAVKWDNLVADWKAKSGAAHAVDGMPETAGLWAEAKGTYRESHTQMGEKAEAFGEAAAREHYIAERYGDFTEQSLLGPKNGNDQFDQMYRHQDGRVVIVEAKSSTRTELGRRTLPDGRQVSQGSREYFLDIMEAMKKRGEFGSVKAIQEALDEGKLEYVVVKGQKNEGAYTGFEYRRFDISKGTL